MTSSELGESRDFIYGVSYNDAASTAGPAKAPPRGQRFEGTVTLECTLCGVVFERAWARAKNSRRHYCAKPCPGPRKPKATGRERGRPKLPSNHSCDGCGVPMRRTPEEVRRDLHRFCTKGCKSAWHAAQWVECQCKWCGMSFSRPPSQMKRGTARFCSYSCRSKHNLVMQAQQDDHNVPERAVHTMLEELGFGFSTNMRFKRWSPDIVVKNTNVVIQVFGVWFHDRYGNSTKPRIEETKERDARTKAALEEAGWIVLILWEDDIKKRPQWCKRQIKRTVILAKTFESRVKWIDGEICQVQ